MANGLRVEAGSEVYPPSLESKHNWAIWDDHFYTMICDKGVMVFNAIFYNISVRLCWSDLLVEVTRLPGDNHWPTTSHKQT